MIEIIMVGKAQDGTQSVRLWRRQCNFWFYYSCAIILQICHNTQLNENISIALLPMPPALSIFSNVNFLKKFFRKTLKSSSLLQRDTPSSIQGIQNCYENYGYATYPDSRVRLALFLHSRSTPGPFG